MVQKITSHLMGQFLSEGISCQYVFDGKQDESTFDDPLLEDGNEVVKGLVHKFPNRALVKVGLECAAHCQFCTRARQIGDPRGRLSASDMFSIRDYLLAHPEIDDLILSGGDPLHAAQTTLKLLEVLEVVPSVRVLRVGTRLPVHAPARLASPAVARLLDRLDTWSLRLPVFMLLHFEHPDELSPDTLKALLALRMRRPRLLAQTVFLRGINIDFGLLRDLFTMLYHLGVQPYYLYHCDAVRGLERFVGDLEQERRIYLRLQAELSGIACPRFVLDGPEGKRLL